jgi:hypothetical protein
LLQARIVKKKKKQFTEEGISLLLAGCIKELCIKTSRPQLKQKKEYMIPSRPNFSKAKY